MVLTAGSEPPAGVTEMSTPQPTRHRLVGQAAAVLNV